MLFKILNGMLFMAVEHEFDITNDYNITQRYNTDHLLFCFLLFKIITIPIIINSKLNTWFIDNKL